MSLRDRASFVNLGLRDKASFILNKQIKQEKKIDIIKQTAQSFPIQVDKQIENILSICLKHLSAREIILFFAEPFDNEKMYHLVGQRGYDLLDANDFIVKEDDVLIQIFKESKELIVHLTSYLDHPVFGTHLKVLWEHYIELGVPLVFNEEIVGFILIGRRFTKDELKPSDIEFLEFISTFWGMILYNAHECSLCYKKIT